MKTLIGFAVLIAVSLGNQDTPKEENAIKAKAELANDHHHHHHHSHHSFHHHGFRHGGFHGHFFHNGIRTGHFGFFHECNWRGCTNAGWELCPSGDHSCFSRHGCSCNEQRQCFWVDCGAGWEDRCNGPLLHDFSCRNSFNCRRVC